MRKSLCLLLVMAVVAWSGCSDLDPGQPPLDRDCAKADDGAGNNLSFPVLWTEGVPMPLRGTYGVTSFLGASTVVDGVELFHQQDLLNEWQAASADMSGAPVTVDWIDWGDNLESRPWPDKAKVRVEVVLYQDLVTPMLGYEMGWVSGLGIDEMWGATTQTYDATQATLYSHCARLTIQKLDGEPEDVAVAWDPALGQWTGDVSEPFYNSGVWYPGDSPIVKYSAEVNVKGKVIYGMLWDVKTQGDGSGTYRLTFSLDGQNATAPLNTYFGTTTKVLVPVEEEPTKGATLKAEPTGGVVHVDVANNLTWIDLPIVKSSGGGGGRPDSPGGGGGGGGSGGGGGHGGGPRF